MGESWARSTADATPAGRICSITPYIQSGAPLVSRDCHGPRQVGYWKTLVWRPVYRFTLVWWVVPVSLSVTISRKACGVRTSHLM